MRTSTLLLVAFVAVTAVVLASGAVVSQHSRHHATAPATSSAHHASKSVYEKVHSTSPKAHYPSKKKHTSHKPVHAIADPSYTPVMAYHVEPQLPPRPLYEATADIEEFHSSGAYDTEMSNVINNAILYAQSLTPANNMSAWVFDIDETSLSGYTEMKSVGFGYVPKLSFDWIQSASAPAIPQTLQLYQTILAQGFRAVFLTGRTDKEHDATATNMQNVGYTTYDTILVRSPAEYNLTATVYKSNRRTQLVEEEGYTIVGCVGDQWSDLNGPYTGFKVKLPNYIYFLP